MEALTRADPPVLCPEDLWGRFPGNGLFRDILARHAIKDVVGTERRLIP